MQNQEIEAMIEAGIPGSRVEVTGDDGTHFEATIVSDEFSGKSRVQQHQMVYKALGAKMGNEIHALSIRTLTRAEWDDRQGLGTI